MKISTKGRYALRLLLDLSRHSNKGFVSLKEVAARQEISVKYLEQIVPMLTKAGLLESVRGSGGGYRLAKPADRYTVGEILRAAEGSLAPVACLGDMAEICPRKGQCATLPFWEGLSKTITEYVDSVKLSDLIPAAERDSSFAVGEEDKTE